MRPATPVLRFNRRPVEISVGAGQPEYYQYPAVASRDGVVTSRWHLSFRERLCVLLFGDIYLSIMTFGAGVAPVKLFPWEPDNEEMTMGGEDELL